MAISTRWRTFWKWFSIVYVVGGLAFLVLFDMGAGALHMSAMFDSTTSWHARVGLFFMALKILAVWPFLLLLFLLRRLS